MSKAMIRTAIELLLLLMVSAGVGLAWNDLRDEGLSLTRDFYASERGRTHDPDSTSPKIPDQKTPEDSTPETASQGGVATNPPPPSDDEPNEVIDTGDYAALNVEWVVDFMSLADGATVVVDARGRDKYETLHIPGAIYLNFYQAEKFIGQVLPTLAKAETIIVYCDGGNCEDSLLLAEYLTEQGIEMYKINIYTGGMREWSKLKLPTVAGSKPGRVPADLAMPAAAPRQPTPAVPEIPVKEDTGPLPTQQESANDPPAESSTDGEPLEHGMQTVTLEEVVMYHQELSDVTVFLDARSRKKYEAGHISGAYYMNHYQSEKLIDTVRDRLQEVDFVIVYCDGGSCEDSINLGSDLIELYNVPYEKVYLFEPGYKAWIAGQNSVTQGESR